MFKIRCTSQQDFTGGYSFGGITPLVGDLVTVIGECFAYDRRSRRVECYQLKEFPGAFAFDKRNFSRIDGPDEREIADARKNKSIAMFNRVWNRIVKPRNLSR